MVSEKRRRELARAKWERQQARRRAAEARDRKLRLIGGVALGIAALVLVGVGIRAVVSGDDSPGVPISTENTLTFKDPPTNTDNDSTAPPTTEPTGTPSSPTRTGDTTATTPTAPVTTATTGSGTP